MLWKHLVCTVKRGKISSAYCKYQATRLPKRLLKGLKIRYFHVIVLVGNFVQTDVSFLSLKICEKGDEVRSDAPLHDVFIECDSEEVEEQTNHQVPSFFPSKQGISSRKIKKRMTNVLPGCPSALLERIRTFSPISLSYGSILSRLPNTFWSVLFLARNIIVFRKLTTTPMAVCLMTCSIQMLFLVFYKDLCSSSTAKFFIQFLSNSLGFRIRREVSNK